MAFDIKTKVTGLVTLIVGIIVIFNLLGGTSADLTTAATNVSGSGLPLAGLFGSSGVILLVFMAGILLTIIFAAMPGKS